MASVAPWWTEWLNAGPTLLGVVFGAGATVWITALQRRWQRMDVAQERQEKARNLTVARGEELLSQCQLLSEWKESARKVAFTREGQGFVPIQGPMYRIAAIVELFFPELSDQAQALDNAVFNYRYYLRGMAMGLQAGENFSPLELRTFNEQVEILENTLGQFQQAARHRVREHIEAA